MDASQENRGWGLRALQTFVGEKRHGIFVYVACIVGLSTTADTRIKCGVRPAHSRTPPPDLAQASRFQIIKTHVGRTAVTEDKESVEEMELAATNSNSLEAWLSTIEVRLLILMPPGELRSKRCCVLSPPPRFSCSSVVFRERGTFWCSEVLTIVLVDPNTDRNRAPSPTRTSKERPDQKIERFALSAWEGMATPTA